MSSYMHQLRKLFLILIPVVIFIVVSFSFKNSSSALIKTANLSAAWRFEGNANDWSGNGYNGTVSGATLATGKFGQGYSFDAGDEISLSNITSLQNASKFTLALWVNANGNDNDAFFSALYDGANNDILFAINSSNVVFAQIDNGADGSGAFTPSGFVGNWSHLALVYDGTQSTNATRLKIYLNGVQQTLTFDGGYTVPATTNGSLGNMKIGSYYFPGWNFAGTLDEVRVFSRALTDAEIRSLMLNYDPQEY